MAKDSDKARLHRDDWKVWEASYKEIPVSQLNMRNPGTGEPMSGKLYLESIPDERDYSGLYKTEKEKMDFFSVFDGVESSSGKTDKLKNLIRTIGSKPGCLTPLRWKVLELWLMGKSKRDITRILYPSRSEEIDKEGSGTVGVEVYVQRLLNHFIPMSIRYYVEMHYPYIVWKYLKYYPLNPIFVKRAWIDASRQEGSTIDNFLKLYSGNPSAFFMLRKIMNEESKSIIKMDCKFYLNPEQTHLLAKHLLFLTSKLDKLDFASVRSIFFKRDEGFKRCRSTMLYIMMNLQKSTTVL